MFGKFSKYPLPSRHKSVTHLFFIITLVLLLGIILTVLNFYQLQYLKIRNDFFIEEKEKISHYSPIVWIQGSIKSKNNGHSGFLKHVYNVFERVGFTVGDNNTDWLVMWSYEYPFEHFEDMLKLKPHQKVNHFPGVGCITYKVLLAQTDLHFIPKAFELPLKRTEFLEFARKNKNISWVQKSNNHRGVQVKTYDQVELLKNGTFVQKYVSNPYLIDGRKFDIGIYTVITAINPLRVYYIDGEALFRFCPVEYYPFNSTDLRKYVVDDEYLPLWEMPSLKNMYSNLGVTFKKSFNYYLWQNGKNSNILWEKMYSAIKEVIVINEPKLIQSSQKYPSKRNFFEMMRFDFVIDEQFNAYLMEANMSPNLSSDHFKENARLYEHVIFNLLNLVGLGQFPSHFNQILKIDNSLEVSEQDIHVFPRFCLQYSCPQNCKPVVCKLCKSCISNQLKVDIKIAFLEHIHRGSARRIFPPPISQADASKWTPESNVPALKHLNLNNQLMYMWFIGKCQEDSAWCY